MTPGQLLRKQLRERPDFDILRSPKPLSVMLDPHLTHADRSMYDFIGFLGWPGNACHQSTRELADVASSDHHQVLRSLKRLFRYGHAQRNADGSISLMSPVFAAESKLVKSKPEQDPRTCVTCGVRKATKRDVTCGPCRTQTQADSEIGAMLDVAPWTDEPDIWKELTARSHGPRYSKEQIESAYHKWHKNQRHKAAKVTA